MSASINTVTATANQQVAKLTAVMAIIQAQVNANPVPVLKESIELIDVLNSALANISSVLNPTSPPYSFTPNANDILRYITNVIKQARKELNELNTTRLPSLDRVITEVDIYDAYIAGWALSGQGFNSEYGATEEDVNYRFSLFAKSNLEPNQWAKLKEVLGKWPEQE